MNYSNGLVTKKRIVEVCKKLFYEKGLVNTTYKDICEGANVRSGTLTHHFSGKENIAADIYLKSMYELDHEIDLLFPEEDKLQRLLISIYAQLKVMYSDNCYCRFKIEYANADIYNGSYMKHLPRILNEIMDEQSEPGSGSYESSMFRAVAFRGMQASLSYYIGQRLEELSFETAYCRWVNLVLLMHGKSKTEIDKRVDRAIMLAGSIAIFQNGLEVHIKPC